MIDNVKLNHPRMITKKDDGTIVFDKLPLSTPVGNLLRPLFEDEPTYE